MHDEAVTASSTSGDTASRYLPYESADLYGVFATAVTPFRKKKLRANSLCVVFNRPSKHLYIYLALSLAFGSKENIGVSQLSAQVCTAARAGSTHAPRRSVHAAAVPRAAGVRHRTRRRGLVPGTGAVPARPHAGARRLAGTAVVAAA